MRVAEAARLVSFDGGPTLTEGDLVTVDGHGGVIYAGAAAVVAAQPDPATARLLAWCEECQRIPVLAAPPDDFTGELVLVPEDEDERAVLVRRLLETPPAGPLGLVLPAHLVGDLDPPPADWRFIVAPVEAAWAGRLLSARVPAPAP
jgi:hypothetical protein